MNLLNREQITRYLLISFILLVIGSIIYGIYNDNILLEKEKKEKIYANDIANSIIEEIQTQSSVNDSIATGEELLKIDNIKKDIDILNKYLGFMDSIKTYGIYHKAVISGILDKMNISDLHKRTLIINKVEELSKKYLENYTTDNEIEEKKQQVIFLNTLLNANRYQGTLFISAGKGLDENVGGYFNKFINNNNNKVVFINLELADKYLDYFNKYFYENKRFLKINDSLSLNYGNAYSINVTADDINVLSKNIKTDGFINYSNNKKTRSLYGYFYINILKENLDQYNIVQLMPIINKNNL